MGKPYIYPATRGGKFYARTKTFKTIDGDEITATLTPLTSGTFLKPCRGPRGGRAYKTCFRQLWTRGGIMYRAAKTEFAPDDWGYTLVPFSGTAFNRYELDGKTAAYRDGVTA